MKDLGRKHGERERESIGKEIQRRREMYSETPRERKSEEKATSERLKLKLLKC